ncbi:NAD-dependent epimerase/dehydratase family protein (plasmid) [Streptomyces sp. BHT-5-2]|uniref:NAD-dependent epimerase/dehydratase family protein n=1 Tax=unclassified Streptomyces TaxID=2593676 RepID=UPI001C8DC42F|nr:NAD-dependent epimerase/dehydratase family protein [Streptomyces sp. BHT-5-2]QZL07798.1 NAD-dependent epimerase/dehydratase family protein [Streptomyces sp. BHT-5-2]
MTGPERVLVTGGTGFLGTEICRRLIARGTETHSFSRRPSMALSRLGVHQHRGDLADPAAVARAVAGCDAVIHTAALAGVSGPARPYWLTNVYGTRNVLRQCRIHAVRTLVHTSTASVVFRPAGLEYADETTPYPTRHLAAYPRTKAQAEQLVLAANRPALATCSLRPHIIWGPGDPHFLPALRRAVVGRRLVMPGDGFNLVDTTHLRTAAHAHLVALDRLHARHSADGQPVAGRAYFIAQGEPRPLRLIVTLLMAAAGIPASWLSAPARLARAAATARETAALLTGTSGTRELSHFLIAELTSPHWFNLTAARQNLGFSPPISFAEGLGQLHDALRPRT